MPTTMPVSGEKPGLIENAGGCLRCPVCNSDRLAYHGVVAATEQLYVTLSKAQAVVEYKGGQLSVDAAVAVFLTCPAEHSTRVNVVFEQGVVRVNTDWDDNQGPGDE